MLFRIAVAVIIIAVIVGFVFNYKRSKAINERGIEADAVVSRIKEIESMDSDGHTEYTYEYFAKYTDQNGQIQEAKLGNPPMRIMEGTKLRVKYLPEKPNYALVVKQ